MSNNPLLSDITKGTELKKTETSDKSGPQIENVHIKKSDRPQLLNEIQQGTDLKKTETSDKSGPQIENVHIKKSDRPQLLQEIQSKSKE